MMVTAWSGCFSLKHWIGNKDGHIRIISHQFSFHSFGGGGDKNWRLNVRYGGHLIQGDLCPWTSQSGCWKITSELGEVLSLIPSRSCEENENRPSDGDMVAMLW